MIPVLLVLVTLFSVMGCSAESELQSATVVIQNGTLLDGTGAEPMEDGLVVARRGTIRAVGPIGEIEVPADARVVDAGGGFIVPGYIDAHVHYSQTGWFDGRPDAADLRDRYPYADVVAHLEESPGRFFRAYLCSGVTGTFDVGGYPWTRDFQMQGAVNPQVPRVEAAGALLSTVDFWLNLPDQKQFIHMADETTVREAVRSHARLGSSAIKVWFITPPEPPDSSRIVRLIEAANDEAETFDLPLIVHATGLWEAKAAIRAGAEVLVHSVFDESVDDEFLQLANDNDVVYTTTLTVMEGYRTAYAAEDASVFPYPTSCVDETTLDKVRQGLPPSKRPGWVRESTPDTTTVPAVATGLQNLRDVYETGITVAMGTDAGNPGTLHGPSIYREMELLARGGMSLMDVLIASTRNAARAMGRADDLGTLENGKLADIVVLEENPLEDVKNFRSVQQVVKGGHVVWPDE